MKTLTFSIVIAMSIVLASAQPHFSSTSLSSLPNNVDLAQRSRQLEQCGIVAAYVAARHFGLTISLPDLVQRTPPVVFNRGMSIEELQSLLETCSLVHTLVPLPRSRAAADARMMLDDGFAIIVPNKAKAHFYVYLAHKNGQFYRYNPPYAAAWVRPEAILLDADTDWGLAVSNSRRHETTSPYARLLCDRTVLSCALISAALFTFWLCWRIRLRFIDNTRNGETAHHDPCSCQQ